MGTELQESRKKGVLLHTENPFWDASDIRVGGKKITVAGGAHVDNETGEMIEHSGIHVVREVDRDEFVKLYTKNVKSIFELKPSSLKLMNYIMHQLQKSKDKDHIYLSWAEAEIFFKDNDIKTSRSSYQNAMKELIDKQFLAESTRSNIYFFNPHLFFNGDRMSFVRTYRLKNNEKTKEITNEAKY